ncbi:hypothetical protein PR048_015286 [Dryococelus australis]|uniref:Uncharacterized protein n=1 Tax=Dryococelus australis TaxID=614101 RepID=A0ABQ9HGJ0_9NEOP|nr:hypothetical protein PR048_015286 [Dryococelus australis]
MDVQQWETGHFSSGHATLPIGQTTRLPSRRIGFDSRYLDFRMWESCGTMALVGVWGFSRSPRSYIPVLLHTHFTSHLSALKTSIKSRTRRPSALVRRNTLARLQRRCKKIKRSRKPTDATLTEACVRLRAAKLRRNNAVSPQLYVPSEYCMLHIAQANGIGALIGEFAYYLKLLRGMYVERTEERRVIYPAVSMVTTDSHR